MIAVPILNSSVNTFEFYSDNSETAAANYYVEIYNRKLCSRFTIPVLSVSLCDGKIKLGLDIACLPVGVCDLSVSISGETIGTTPIQIYNKKS